MINYLIDKTVNCWIVPSQIIHKHKLQSCPKVPIEPWGSSSPKITTISLITKSEWRTRLYRGKIVSDKNITFDISPDKTITLPEKLSKLAESIIKSRYILDLEDDFDDEGSSGYEFETWKRAVDFLVNSAKWTLEKNNAVIDSPNIYHGPDGSIDVLWKNADYRLLINFPKDNANPVTFYGDDCKANKIEGTFDLSKNDFGLLQLMLKTIY